MTLFGFLSQFVCLTSDENEPSTIFPVLDHLFSESNQKKNRANVQMSE